MNDLIAYIFKHTQRGPCQCGRCLDVPAGAVQPTGHTADLIFFKVAALDANADELRRLIEARRKGEFADVNPLDGLEHNYMELGAWIGDQGTALQLMGLGSLVGLWKLLTPRVVFADAITDRQAMQMAGAGMVSIQATP